MAGENTGDEPRVVRDVEPSAVADLLERPPRATLAFVDRGRPDVLPVRARHRAGTYRFGVPSGSAVDLDGRDIVLVLDDGAYWFELRGVSVRGVAKRAPHAEPGDTETLAWYVIEPGRILAWDYGALREA